MKFAWWKKPEKPNEEPPVEERPRFIDINRKMLDIKTEPENPPEKKSSSDIAASLIGLAIREIASNSSIQILAEGIARQSEEDRRLERERNAQTEFSRQLTRADPSSASGPASGDIPNPADSIPAVGRGTVDANPALSSGSAVSMPTPNPIRIGYDRVQRQDQVQYLRPIPGVLFDTEIIPGDANGTPISSLSFFRRPLGQGMEYRLRTKTPSETCMLQSGCLPHPQEFSVFELALFIEEGVSEADKNLILNTGILRFGVGTFMFPDIPLVLFPRYSKAPLVDIVSREYEEALRAQLERERREREQPNAAAVRRAHTGSAQTERESRPVRIDLRTGVKLLIGRSAVKIRPNVFISCMIEWSQLIRLSKDTRVMVSINGLWWRPITASMVNQERAAALSSIDSPGGSVNVNP